MATSARTNVRNEFWSLFGLAAVVASVVWWALITRYELIGDAAIGMIIVIFGLIWVGWNCDRANGAFGAFVGSLAGPVIVTVLITIFLHP